MLARSGEVVTYRELTERSRRAAQLMRQVGAERGSAIAFMLENHPRFLELAWGAQRAGLRYTAISPRLTADEVAYMLEDSGARVVFASAQTADVAREAAARAGGVGTLISVDGPLDGLESYDELVAGQPAEPLADEAEGLEFLYSSGTTGRPKAIKAELALDPIGTPPGIVPLFERLYGFGADTVYLSPAPLYHSAPLRFNMAVHRLGGTTVVMDRFDPDWALELIERHGVTHVQMVPTMFIRLLRLSDEERAAHDISSLRKVIHAAAPCPPDVKREMIEWLGPIVEEYYSATEVYLLTAIDAEDWLAHPGSVGKALVGTPHIVDDDGNELPVGEVGTVWSEGGPSFEYHNAPGEDGRLARRAGLDDRRRHRLPRRGRLSLPDRPQGRHDHLGRGQRLPAGGRERAGDAPGRGGRGRLRHPARRARRGGQGRRPAAARREPAGDELEDELIAYCHERLAKYKCPRTIDFTDELPRHPTGKLYKRLLRDHYAEAARRA